MRMKAGRTQGRRPRTTTFPVSAARALLIRPNTLGEPGEQRVIEHIDGIGDRGPDQFVGTGARDHGPVRLGQRRHVGGSPVNR